jgi:uncharacterized protein involved in exopolysaccharide biosynthesis
MAYPARKANALANLNTTLAISTTIQTLNTQSTTQQGQATDLRNQIQAIRAQISDVSLSAETYEKDFIDKNSMYSGPKRIQTLQDGIFAFFFASYIALAIVIALSQLRATKNFTVAGTTLFAFFLLGILIVEIVRRYA